MKKKVFSLLFFLNIICSSYSWSNTSSLDSLKSLLTKANHDSSRCNLLGALVEVETNDSIWPRYNQQLLEISERNSAKLEGKEKEFYLAFYALALNNKGYFFNQHGDNKSSRLCYLSALRIYESLNNKQGVAATYINIGYGYRQDGNIKKALEYYHNGLKIQIELGEKLGMATSYNNIAFIFDNQGEYNKALEYYTKALTIYNQVKNKDGEAACYLNLAFIFETYGIPSCASSKEKCKNEAYLQAIDYLKKSISLYEEIKEHNGLANALNVLGGIYDHYQNPNCTEPSQSCKLQRKREAFDCYNRALNLRLGTNNTSGICLSYNSIAEHFLLYDDPKSALKYALLCMKHAKELEAPERIMDAALTLKKVFEKMNQFKEALNMHELYIQMKDSIFNQITRNETIRKEFQIEYEKQAVKDSLENIAKIKETQLKSELAIAKQRQYTYTGLIGFALMLLVAVISFRAFKNKQKANVIITEQKLITEQQKELIEHKQKKIIDSITYAKRLQEAILPPQSYIDKYIPENFVWYRPKDIVAGDFYWMHVVDFEDLKMKQFDDGNPSKDDNVDDGSKPNLQIPQSSNLQINQSSNIQIGKSSNQKIYIAAADSTGHGVPGALVSVVCSNALNRAVKEFGLMETGKILDKTRELVLETFEKSSNDVKDGMDISLLCIDHINKKIHWSGAHNSLWYIRNNEWFEIKADKQAIGKTIHPKPFATHQIDYVQGINFYLFTDGFPDQFGGPNGRKFKYNQFAELIKITNQLPPEEQLKIIENTFLNWKGNLDQIDDVCMLRISIV